MELIVPFLDFTLFCLNKKHRKQSYVLISLIRGQGINLARNISISMHYFSLAFSNVSRESIGRIYSNTRANHIAVLEILHLDNQMELHPRIHTVTHSYLSMLSSILCLADFLPASNTRLVTLSHSCQHFSS